MPTPITFWKWMIPCSSLGIIYVSAVLLFLVLITSEQYVVSAGDSPLGGTPESENLTFKAHFDTFRVGGRTQVTPTRSDMCCNRISLVRCYVVFRIGSTCKYVKYHCLSCQITGLMFNFRSWPSPDLVHAENTYEFSNRPRCYLSFCFPCNACAGKPVIWLYVPIQIFASR